MQTTASEVDDGVEGIVRQARMIPATPNEGPATKRSRSTEEEEESSLEEELRIALFETLRLEGDDPDDIAQFTQWLIETCSCSRGKALILLQMGVPALLLAALQKWSEETNLQARGFIWVKDMVTRLDFPDAFLSMGWFETILDAMEFHSFTLSIHEQGMTTLATLLEFEDETFLDVDSERNDLLLEKVLALVIQSMQRFPGSHAVQEKGCELLGHLSTCAKTRNSFRGKLLQSNAVVVVKRAMDICSFHSEETKNHATRFLKHVEALSHVLVREVRCNLLQQFTAEVTDKIANEEQNSLLLSDNSPDSSSCPKAAYAKTVRSLLFQSILQKTDATRTETAFGSISSLIGNDEDRAITATLMGVHAAVIVGMRTWSENRTVQTSGMQFLKDLIRSLPMAATDWPIRRMMGHMLEYITVQNEANSEQWISIAEC